MFFSFPFPVRQSTIKKRPCPSDLVPWVPKASWDGFFAIAIFTDPAAPFWVKAHLFHTKCGKGWHPTASLEGFEAKSEFMIAAGYSDRIELSRCEVDTSRLIHDESRFLVNLPDVFSFSGKAPDYTMSFKTPGKNIEARFDFKTSWPIWWADFGRLFQYVGQHSMVDLDLKWESEHIKSRGLGVMEHVCGASTPFNITSVLPIHYHWDVLSFQPDHAEAASAAGLSIGVGGKTMIRLRAAIKLPGEAPAPADGLTVRYVEFGKAPTGNSEIAVPARWEGRLKTAKGILIYEARAATPVANLIPGGGMLGFDFNGEWRPDKTSKTVHLEGRGFAEYGDFTDTLLNQSKL